MNLCVKIHLIGRQTYEVDDDEVKAALADYGYDYDDDDFSFRHTQDKDLQGILDHVLYKHQNWLEEAKKSPSIDEIEVYEE